MIRIGICDDEDVIRKEICCLLKNEEIECMIHEYSSGEQVLFDNNIIDILLLDIELIGVNGIDVAFRLREKSENLYIIFLTSHNEYMSKAFHVKAYRFLKKPINKVELIQAIKEAEKELINQQVIIIEDRGRKSVVKIGDIVYLEAFGDGTYIFTKDEIYTSTKTLKYYINKLGTEHFIKTHKSYVVSLKKIICIEETEIVLLEINEKIPVSRRNRKVVKEEFDRYLVKYAKCIV